MVAQDDFSSGRDFQADQMGADGDAALRRGADGRLLAPHIRPPRATRGRPQNGTFLDLRIRPSLLRSHLKLAMDFELIVMQAEGCDMRIRIKQLRDRLAGKVSR